MDDDLKKYADALYDAAQMESARKARQRRADAIETRSLHASILPLSGPDIGVMIEVYDNHIGRCVAARLESYETAYAEAGRTPTEQDFAEILEDCKSVRIREIGHSARAIKGFIGPRAVVGVPAQDAQPQLEKSSAHGYDIVVQKWKTWKAKTQLQPAPAKVQGPEKQTDVSILTHKKPEFEIALASLASKGDTPCALLFLDLDKFKSINDTLGHLVGDQALREFANGLLRACDRKGAIYRVGGDEFCVLLPNHSLDEAAAVAERILREVRTVKIAELPDGLSTSIGVACFPESAGDHTELVSQADGAMYVSKRAGGNRVKQADRR